MDGLLKSPEVASLIPEVDLSARVIYFPVRHHSPACAWHVRRLIEQIKPDAVLIEGPRDATPLIPLLTHEKVRMPVAIYATYVKRRSGEVPARHAAYYPLCEYSPELAAIRVAKEVGARASFIDLTFPESVEACKEYPDDKVQSLFEEKHLEYSRFLHLVCQKTGLRDPNDLWDHLYEDDYMSVDTPVFMRNVLAYCALGRRDYTDDMLKSDGCLAREAAMAACIAEEKGRVVVVTGGFHSVALPSAQPKMPKQVRVAEEDAQVVLTRYSFEQLDKLNGYASGMPSPEFYQRIWERQDATKIIVELGALIRERGGEVSTADEVFALAHTRRLAMLRGHNRPSREDVLDGIRSVFIKGSVDVEGVFILTLARKLFAGERVGDVPPEAGQPPIVLDFRQTAEKLKVSLDAGQIREAVLDIYRRTQHREISRFLHRLRFMEVPFGVWQRGPDFVSGANLDRIQEVWEYRWHPGTESALIERSLYGPTVEEASAALLLTRFTEMEKEGQGRRADAATGLLLEACRMGLHKHTQDLLDRTGKIVAEDASFVSLAHAITDILMLHVSREPLEAHHLVGLADMAEQAFERGCYLLPGLAGVAENEEEEALDALIAFSRTPEHLGGLPEHKELFLNRLKDLFSATTGSTAIRGGACGLLFGEGIISPEELAGHLKGHLLSQLGQNGEGVSFLRGVLKTARNALWQVPEVLESVTELLSEWNEESFIRQLPNLRLTFADLTPRECDRVAHTIAENLGVKAPAVVYQQEYSYEDVTLAAEVNRRVLEALERDGLRGLVDPESFETAD